MIIDHKDTKQTNTPYISSLILFGFSLLYLYSELIFNALMLDVAGTSFSEPNQIEDIQYYGRIISANGFTLLLLGLFARSGFRLWTPSHWILALLCALVCSIPFFMIFGETIYSMIFGKARIEAGFDTEMGWSLMIVPGGYLFFQSGGHNRSLIALGIIVMAWPAMFFGQKLLIERYVVAPTSWEQRLGARYVLMARTKSEECSMKFGDLDTCRAWMRGEDIRSLNAVLAAVMLNAKNIVLADVGREKNKVLLNEVLRVNSKKIDKAYQYYLSQLLDLQDMAYRKYHNNKKRFVKFFYQPYLQASRQYELATKLSPPMIEFTDDLMLKVAEKKAQAWKQYWMEASNYNTSISSLARQVKDGLVELRAEAYNCDSVSCEGDKLRLLRHFQKEYSEQLEAVEKLCGGNLLEYNCKMTKEDIAQKLHEGKDDEFIEKSGYMPDIKTQEDFFALPKNQNLLREGMKSSLPKKMRGISFDAFSFSDNLTQDMMQEHLKAEIIRRARIKWTVGMQKRFDKYIPPGLSLENFAKTLGVEFSLEDVDITDNVLAKKEFIEKYILPEYKIEVVKYFDQIESEAPGYANGEKLSRQGMNYIRAVYIPPIAIGLSLLIVILTIGKNIIFVISSLFLAFNRNKFSFGYLQPVFNTFAWIAFLTAVTVFINSRENIYTKNDTYQKYYQVGYRNSPAIMMILDSTIRAQPIIYRQGSIFLK